MTLPSKVGSQKILVVDDDLDTLKLVGTTLEKQGFIIVAAKDGQEALEKVTQHMPDLILLDIMMPKMDGYEVTRRLKGDPATANIPIVLFTAKAQVDDKVAGLEVGADDYLTKPTHPAELVARVRSILKRPVTSVLPPLPVEGGNHIIGVIAAKGGQGASSLAINLASGLLNQHKGASVALAELRPGRGDISVFLGYKAQTGLTDLLKRAPGDIHRQVVESALVAHKSGLKLLLSSNNPIDFELIAAKEQMAAIVRELARIAQFCVLDVGVGLPESTQRVFKQCTKVVVLAEPDPHTIEQTKSLIEGLKAIGLGPEKLVAAMVNRVRTDMALNASEVHRLIGLNIEAIFTPAPELAFQATRAHQSMLDLEPQSYTAQQTLKLVNLVAQPNG